MNKKILAVLFSGCVVTLTACNAVNSENSNLNVDSSLATQNQAATNENAKEVQSEMSVVSASSRFSSEELSDFTADMLLVANEGDFLTDIDKSAADTFSLAIAAEDALSNPDEVDWLVNSQSAEEFNSYYIEISHDELEKNGYDISSLGTAYDTAKYNETGFSYTSFYNTISGILDSEYAEKLLINNPLYMEYNGELWVRNVSRSGNVSWRGTEYEITESSASEIFVTETKYYVEDWETNSDFEFHADSKDQYIAKAEAIVLKHGDNGWRFSRLSSSETETITVYSSEASQVTESTESTTVKSTDDTATSESKAINATAASSDENIGESYSGRYLKSGELSEMSFKSGYCKDGSVIALTDGGDVVTWGSNRGGEIGNGECGSHIDAENAAVSEPYYINFSEGISTVGNSWTNSYAITESGKVYIWGYNSFGEAGIIGSNILTPQEINTGYEISKISMNNSTTLFLTEGGEVLLSGIDVLQYDSLQSLNENVAYEVVEDEPIPITVADEGYKRLDLSFKCTDVSVGLLSYSFLSDSGEVYVWGRLLGDYDNKNIGIYHSEPEKINFPEKITEISCGSNYVAALSESGRVYLYGTRESVFFSEASDSEVSENIFLKGALQNIKGICNYLYCTVAIDNDGKVWGFGIDNDGSINPANIDDEASTHEIITEPYCIYQDAVFCSTDTANSLIISSAGKILIQGSDWANQVTYCGEENGNEASSKSET